MTLVEPVGAMGEARVVACPFCGNPCAPGAPEVPVQIDGDVDWVQCCVSCYVQRTRSASRSEDGE